MTTIVPYEHMGKDSSRPILSQYLRNFDAYEGGTRTSSYVGNNGEFEYNIYDYYHRDNIPNRQTDPNYELWENYSQVDLKTQHAIGNEAHFNVQYTAQNQFEGVPGRFNDLENRGYTEAPFMHSENGIWSRLLRSDRDFVENHGIGFQGMNTEISDNRMGIMDNKFRGRQVKNTDFNSTFYSSGPIIGVGPGTGTQEISTQTHTFLSDRQSRHYLDPSLYGAEASGIVEY